MKNLLQIKKERSEKENQEKPLRFFIGLSIALLFCIIVINWKSYDQLGTVDLGTLNADFEETIEIPISKQLPPPPPPSQKIVKITEVEDDVEIEEEIELVLDVEMTEETEVEEYEYQEPEEIEEEVVEEIFHIVEDHPQPVGGMSAFYEYVAENLNYPHTARRLNVEGMVFVRFVVEKNGSIQKVEVVKGIGAGCDEEAARVIRNAPAWNPGKQRGRPVRVYMTVPIRFILQN